MNMEMPDASEESKTEHKQSSSDAHRDARKELVRILGDEAPLKWNDALIDEAKRKEDIDRQKYPDIFDDTPDSENANG
jgi:hypothetical protein